MSDFLVSFGCAVTPESLLKLLLVPYGSTARAGRAWGFPWGTAAALEDLIAKSRNVIEENCWVACWVGDAPGAQAAIRELIKQCVLEQGYRASAKEAAQRLAKCQATEKLNGAFAICILSSQFICVITDPMSAVQVYAAIDVQNEVEALGTHPDLVAVLANQSESVDPISVAEFLDRGTPTKPHTMYKAVRELEPGHVYVLKHDAIGTRVLAWAPYWIPPAELEDEKAFDELSVEFGRSWVCSVEARCEGNVIGVLLSGGLDSRLVMASVPRQKRCIGLTFCDRLNREARIARKVARVYGREWQMLQRDREYVARTAVDAIRFTGCEGEWHHAHALGFVAQIEAMGIDEVFTGLFMDNNFKAYYGRDWVPVKRFRGLLPSSYQMQQREFATLRNEVWHGYLNAEVIDGIIERRRKFYDAHFARGRQSEWEWLEGYPLSQSADNTGWIVERRVLPLRLPVNDRRLIELAFHVPAGWKVGGLFFERSILTLLGAGRRVPNANNGVRPGSKHFSRLFQRGLRKTQNSLRSVLVHFGMDLPVPHSWHDYERYWRESAFLDELRRKHGANTLKFQGTVFTSSPEILLCQKDLSWEVGSRLLQLGIWLTILDEYRQMWSRERVLF